MTTSKTDLFTTILGCFSALFDCFSLGCFLICAKQTFAFFAWNCQSQKQICFVNGWCGLRLKQYCRTTAPVNTTHTSIWFYDDQKINDFRYKQNRSVSETTHSVKVKNRSVLIMAFSECAFRVQGVVSGWNQGCQPNLIGRQSWSPRQRQSALLADALVRPPDSGRRQSTGKSPLRVLLNARVQQNVPRDFS